MRSTILTILFLLPLVPASTLADDGATESPSRFYSPTSWNLEIHLSCDLDVKPDDIGSHYEIHDTADVRGRVDTRAAIDMAATRVLHGKPDGSSSVNDVMVDVTKLKKMVWRDVNDKGPDPWRVEDLDESEIANNGQCSDDDNRDWQVNGLHCEHPTDAVITTTSKLTATGLGDRADLRLEIHAAYGNYYVLGVTDLAPKGTMTVAIDTLVNGKSTHTQTEQDGSKDLGFLSQRMPLPAHGMILTGSATVDGQPCPTFKAGYTATRTIHWTAKPVDMKDLQAVPGGPYNILRGEKVSLDGSGSTGNPTHFKWTITPKPCPSVRTATGSVAGPTVGAKSHDGAHWDATMLCDAEATLEVSDDGGRSDTKSVAITVLRRPWKMPFDTEGPTPFQAMFGSEKVFGQNECKDDAGRHWIHARTGAGGANDWRPFVQFDAVADADSPFDGYSFAKSARDLHIARVQHVNSELYPSGDAGQDLYDFNVANKHGADVRLVQKGTERHEALHSELAKTAVEGGEDPMIDLEGLVAKDAATLPDLAQQTIQRADNALYQASSEDAVHARLAREGFSKKATLLIPGGSPFVIPDVASCGDGGTPQGAPAP